MIRIATIVSRAILSAGTIVPIRFREPVPSALRVGEGLRPVRANGRSGIRGPACGDADGPSAGIADSQPNRDPHSSRRDDRSARRSLRTRSPRPRVAHPSREPLRPRRTIRGRGGRRSRPDHRACGLVVREADGAGVRPTSPGRRPHRQRPTGRLTPSGRHCCTELRVRLTRGRSARPTRRVRRRSQRSAFASRSTCASSRWTVRSRVASPDPHLERGTRRLHSPSP